MFFSTDICGVSPYGEPARRPGALGTAQGRIHLSCGFLSSVQNSRLGLLLGLFAQGGDTAPLPSFHWGKMWGSGLDPERDGPLKVSSLLLGLLLLSSLSSLTPFRTQASRPLTSPQGWEAVFRAQCHGALHANGEMRHGSGCGDGTADTAPAKRGGGCRAAGSGDHGGQNWV